MKQAIVACTIIYQKIDNQLKVLLTKRSLSSDFLPGVYEIPGGHIEYGEDLASGLARELKEELNLTVEIGDLFSAFTYTHNSIHTVELVYLATPLSDLTKLKIQEDEIAEVRWINESEIDTIVSLNKDPNDQEVLILKKAFKHI